MSRPPIRTAPERDPIKAIEDPELRIATLAVRFYAETHPRPTQVSMRQAAEMHNVSYRTVRRLVQAGRLRLNGCGYIAIEDLEAIRSS